MNDAAFECHAPSHAAPPGKHWLRAQSSVEFGRERDRRHIPQLVASPDREAPFGVATKSRGGLKQRVEHWLQIEGRAADDLEDIAGRGLVFERFLEVVGAI